MAKQTDEPDTAKIVVKVEPHWTELATKEADELEELLAADKKAFWGTRDAPGEAYRRGRHAHFSLMTLRARFALYSRDL